MNIARVVIDKAAYAYDKEYDYLLPDTICARAGCRVLVPFGTGNRTRIGLVLSVLEPQRELSTRLKAVHSLLDTAPLLDEEGLLLLAAVRTATFCTWFEALRVLIPPGMGLKVNMGLSPVREKHIKTEHLSPEAQQLYTLLVARRGITPEDKALSALGLSSRTACIEELTAANLVTRSRLIKKRIADERAVMARLVIEEATESESRKYTPKQQAVVNLLEQIGCASVRELCYFAGATRAVVDRMQKQGVLELFEEVTPRRTADKTQAITDTVPIILSEQQQRAFETLRALGHKNEFTTSLLHGVTGSGKTQVFLRLIEDVLARGRQAMVLIPEISLTPQTVSKFSARFGPRVAVLHSSLSMTERLDEWQRIREGKADIVVGTRSAVFAPLHNIGLIVIDEEQEHTYHSESSPRYHARDIARLRGKTHNAQVLLCSATPSVESYYNAVNGRYHLVELSERYSGNLLPDVLTVDMREVPLNALSTTLSEELCEQIRETLERGEQSILLLNRRGYNTMVKCSSCGEVARCPHCSIPLTFHAANRRLVCHYCGYSRAETVPCDNCKSAMLRYTGVGTQRIEEELKALFPPARILRMDMDTTMSRFAHQRAFEAFVKGDYDIMVGTQMVAKGLDFPNVTLVGVLAADQSLYGEDFRSFERTFSLITQVVGRCGRAQKPGRAVIQTFTPENRILALAAAQDYKAFYSEEIAYRRVGLYPPFCDIVCVVFWAEKERIAVESAKAYSRQFIEAAKENFADLPIRLLGPSECRPYRVAGRYRCRLLVKCRGGKRTRALFAQMLAWYYQQKNTAAITLDFYYDSNL
ncbi:MAG: primosomal protein N' [Candidatus Fimivivens sp.]|nr:primosomal protein N' [Candidatus Fimivivens sp.]